MKQAIVIFSLALFFSCGKKQASGEQSTTIKPSLSGVCGYLTRQEVETALGIELAEEPSEINEEYLGGKGCAYNGIEEDTEAHFAYVIFTTPEEFEKVKAGEKTEGAGDEAYTINGPDAQQLWVREGNTYLMIAIGDAPKPTESKQLAALILNRLKTKPLSN